MQAWHLHKTMSLFIFNTKTRTRVSFFSFYFLVQSDLNSGFNYIFGYLYTCYVSDGIYIFPKFAELVVLFSNGNV